MLLALPAYCWYEPPAKRWNLYELNSIPLLEKVQVPVEYPEGSMPLTHGKPGTAEEVADLVLFLASDLSSHITGSEMWIDGAESLLKG